ncbi:MAG: glycosyltransferase family 9 protein [Saprospiraceae bacterium]
MKILVLRFSSIGDVVLCSPVVRCLKKQTGAEIHFLTKKNYRSLLDTNPYIDKVWAFEKEPAEILDALRKEKFTLVVDLHRNLRSLLLKIRLRRPSRSFSKLNIQKWILVNTGINLLPSVQIVDRYLETVSSLNVHNDGEGLDYFIPEAEHVEVGEWSPELQPGNYLCLAIGATHATKRMPYEKMQELCRQAPCPVVLLGGKDMEEIGQQLAKSTGAIQLCGKLSLHQSASFIQQAAAVVSPDTGMMHIAAALRKPIGSIWGSTVPEFGMYPYFPTSAPDSRIFEVKNLPCRPCSKIGYSKCPKGHFNCMHQIKTGEIVQWLAEKMQTAG